MTINTIEKRFTAREGIIIDSDLAERLFLHVGDKLQIIFSYSLFANVTTQMQEYEIVGIINKLAISNFENDVVIFPFVDDPNKIETAISSSFGIFVDASENIDSEGLDNLVSNLLDTVGLNLSDVYVSLQYGLAKDEVYTKYGTEQIFIYSTPEKSNASYLKLAIIQLFFAPLLIMNLININAIRELKKKLNYRGGSAIIRQKFLVKRIITLGLIMQFPALMFSAFSLIYPKDWEIVVKQNIFFIVTAFCSISISVLFYLQEEKKWKK